MILRRLGNKKKIAHKIIEIFPDHKIYIEPFFGAGGIFFQKPKAQYNIVNDLDSDVFNLFQVVMNQKEELEKAFYMMPIHSDLLDYWKKNLETEPIKKALRFLFLSNFSLYNKMDTLRISIANDKNPVYLYLDKVFELLHDVQFINYDFRDIFKKISLAENEYETFIYADPPYIESVDTYTDSDTWTKKDSIDLFNVLQETGCKFAMSEFNNPFIIDQAKQKNLNIRIIGERQNLKNRRTEILITNYQKIQKELFDE